MSNSDQPWLAFGSMLYVGNYSGSKARNLPKRGPHCRKPGPGGNHGIGSSGLARPSPANTLDETTVSALQLNSF